MWVNFDSTPFRPRHGAGRTGGRSAGTGVNPPSHWADHDSPCGPRGLRGRRSPDGKVPVMK
jgi:hypothetical protein